MLIRVRHTCCASSTTADSQHVICSFLGPLTTEECRVAVRFWIRDQRQQSYGDAINDLRMKKQGQTIIRQLRLLVDYDCCIRGAGRSNGAHLPEATKLPLLLPSKGL
ncbi:hypothetical protein DPMN_064011 [Dreissena polymorpha]|uniref:Uncharacterized protein n=1 Tax=Dreissena polymorpha TaxID=45954 RepID=A0A9D4CCK2_DREPO|nr:hypothetical protein DPMN_064011 [Dreissena polymorpha]